VEGGVCVLCGGAWAVCCVSGVLGWLFEEDCGEKKNQPNYVNRNGGAGTIIMVGLVTTRLLQRPPPCVVGTRVWDGKKPTRLACSPLAFFVDGGGGVALPGA
jgi:hypothetical protein